MLWFFTKIFKFTKNSNLFADPFEMAKFTKSLRGYPQLVDMAGYEYVKIRNATSGVKIYWRCSKYRSLKCSAKAITEGSYVIRSLGEQCQHNHWNKCFFYFLIMETFKFLFRYFWRGKVYHKFKRQCSAYGLKRAYLCQA